MSITIKQKNIISMIIVSCMAVVFFLFLYSEILNPKYDAWLLTAGADPAQHYIGWMMYRDASWSNFIITKEWVEYSKDYKHIFFLPVIPHINYVPFTLYAATNNLTVNNGYFARSIKKLDIHIEEQINDAREGKYDCNTVYIFSKDMEKFYPNIDLKKHLLTAIEKAHILYPCYKQNHSEVDVRGIEFKLYP